MDKKVSQLPLTAEHRAREPSQRPAGLVYLVNLIKVGIVSLVIYLNWNSGYMDHVIQGLGSTILSPFSAFVPSGSLPPEADQSHCPQAAPYVWPNSSDIEAHFPSSSQLAQLLSGAVQIDTSVGDDWPTVKDDPAKWQAVFSPFRDYLKRALPLVHASNSPITLELVNQHALLYTWKGNRKDWKPVVFMAHQDVVPVEPETVDRWTHPPFSGFIDEKLGLIWGRGASDTKMSLVSILSAFETLLAAGFEPERTLIASFGIDEESSGTQGGQKLVEFLVDRYGQDGAAMIIDEGAGVLRAEDGLGINVATPAVAEKGYLDVRITVASPGGHSSAPRPHTSIGYLSQLITAVEANPHPPQLRLNGNPALDFLQCTRDAPNTNPNLSKALKKLQRLQEQPHGHRHHPCRLFRKLEKLQTEILNYLSQEERFIFQTTQAVDLIQGGVKVNALPETASAVINHRIEVGSSVSEVRQWIHSIIQPVAKQFDLQVIGDGPNWSFIIDSPDISSGKIILSDAFESALEPAPLTPLGSAKPWTLLSSVIKSTWSNILVAPTIMGGNTDTRSYWLLCKHLFRFTPQSLNRYPILNQDNNIHTVDEREMIQSIVVALRFYIGLMRAVCLEEL